MKLSLNLREWRAGPHGMPPSPSFAGNINGRRLRKRVSLPLAATFFVSVAFAQLSDPPQTPKVLQGIGIEQRLNAPIPLNTQFTDESGHQVRLGDLESVMPTFEGQLNEEQLLALIAYIKAIGPAPGTQQPTSSGTSPRSVGQQPGIAGPGATSISGSKPGDR